MKGKMALEIVERSIIIRKMTTLRAYNKKVRVQARASLPYELVPNILRYTFNNL